MEGYRAGLIWRGGENGDVGSDRVDEFARFRASV